MKKLLVNLFLICAVTMSFANPPVTEQVLKQFAATFPAISDARWYESDDHYDVYFESEGIKYNVRYNRQGKILSTRNSYPGTKLCPFLKAKVAEKFADKTIFGVTEFTTNDERTYVIVLEDAATWTKVMTNSVGHLTVIEKLKKA